MAERDRRDSIPSLFHLDEVAASVFANSFIFVVFRNVLENDLGVRSTDLEDGVARRAPSVDILVLFGNLLQDPQGVRVPDIAEGAHHRLTDVADFLFLEEPLDVTGG